MRVPPLIRRLPSPDLERWIRPISLVCYFGPNTRRPASFPRAFCIVPMTLTRVADDSGRAPLPACLSVSAWLANGTDRRCLYCAAIYEYLGVMLIRPGHPPRSASPPQTFYDMSTSTTSNTIDRPIPSLRYRVDLLKYLDRWPQPCYFPSMEGGLHRDFYGSPLARQ